MKWNREEAIERLVEDTTQNLMQFALSDFDSLREYVRQAERFEDIDTNTLKNLYESAFGEEIEE
jgi:hypothetical protein